MAKPLPSLATLREEATALGIDPAPFGRSKKGLLAAIEQSKIAAKAMQAKTAGTLDWGTAIQGKKTTVKRTTARKTVKARKTVVSPTVRKPAPATPAPSVEGVPAGMKRVKYPGKYDPNNPQPRKNGAGPRMMVCGHQEWWWDKKEGKCLSCFPRNAFGR